jgi:D-alanine-D-alanine ligase
MLLPHRISSELLITYADAKVADTAEAEVRELLGKRGPKWSLSLVSDRPPFRDRRSTKTLTNLVRRVAAQWDIPFAVESSVWPSVAGLAPSRTQVLCGMGPSATGLYTPNESVSRISLIQRTLLLAQILLEQE